MPHRDRPLKMAGARAGTITALLLLSAAAAGPARGQAPEIDGYYLNLGLWSDSSPFARSGLAGFQRLRLMSARRIGPLSLDVAYEHLLSYTQRAGAELFGTAIAGVAPTGATWLDLDWTLERGSRVTWRHRFDRLSASIFPTSGLEIVAGRQTISWATTLLLSPADPFAPFDPSDPFREYRAGVDALRARWVTGPFSELDLVIRPIDGPRRDLVTALARGRTLWMSWEVSGWAGALHEEAALGVGAAGALAGTAVRGEGSLRDAEDGLAVRVALGLDRRLALLDRDLFVVLEYQHDDFGATGGDDLPRVLFSDPLGRGELQLLGRDAAALQASYDLHPLWSGSLLLLSNLRDGSLLLGPAATYSLSDEATLRAGAFLGLGDGDPSPAGIPRSEFGPVPGLVYASGSVFF